MNNEELIEAVDKALLTIDKALEHITVLDMRTLGMKSEGWLVVDHENCNSHAVTVTEVPWTE